MLGIFGSGAICGIGGIEGIAGIGGNGAWFIVVIGDVIVCGSRGGIPAPGPGNKIQYGLRT